MLKVGERAPLFSAEGTKGHFDLRDYVGKKHIVLLFYSSNDSAACARQLSAARDDESQFIKLDTLVVGINQAGLTDHRDLALRKNYDFPLLHDKDLLINRLYEVGKSFMGPAQQRTIYVIGKDGLIHYAEHGARPTDEIMEAIRKSMQVKAPE